MRALIRQVLENAAHDVIECDNGQEAVRLWDGVRPDLTLMDLELPGLDGLTALRAIRDSVPTARVMMLTAHDSPALRQAAQAGGAVGYTLKSDLGRLAEVVRQQASTANLSPQANRL